MAVQYLRLNNFNLIGVWPTIAISLATAALVIIFSTVTQGALVRATIAHSEGREASLAESAAAGLVVIVPLFLLGLGSALGIGIGFLLLIVPGVMLYVIWSVAGPALVAEGIGVFEAFGRSSELTDGARWKIFGFLLILLVASWMFQGVLGSLTLVLYGGIKGAALMATQGFTLSYFVLTALEKTVTTVVGGVMLTSLYVELRNWKDGPPTSELADVFG